MDRIIKFVLTLLGFVSASSLDGCVTKAEYGTPEVEYTVKGRVVNKAGHTIKGLYISNSRGESYDSDRRYDFESVLSGSDGRFELKSRCFYSEDSLSDIYITDVDGEENGGKFADKHLSVTFGQSDLTSQKNWKTYYSKDLGDITLELEEE